MQRRKALLQLSLGTRLCTSEAAQGSAVHQTIRAEEDMGMKIIVTGQQSGLGKYMHEHFKRTPGYEVYGIGTTDVHRGHAVPITDPVGPAEVSATY